MTSVSAIKKSILSDWVILRSNNVQKSFRKKSQHSSWSLCGKVLFMCIFLLPPRKRLIISNEEKTPFAQSIHPAGEENERGRKKKEKALHISCPTTSTAHSTRVAKIPKLENTYLILVLSKKYNILFLVVVRYSVQLCMSYCTARLFLTRARIPRSAQEKSRERKNEWRRKNFYPCFFQVSFALIFLHQNLKSEVNWSWISTVLTKCFGKRWWILKD